MMSHNNGVRRSSIRAPKVGHKKSRKGCQTCKARRVKCDETYPQCKACLRLGLDCGYTNRDSSSSRPQTQTPSQSQHSPVAQASQTSPSMASVGHVEEMSTDNTTVDELPQDPETEETKQRRILELKLLHHWMIHVSGPFGMTSPPSWKELWYGEVPRIALEHENVLYGLYSMSATHLLGRFPNDEALAQARENYWVWTLRKQRAAIADLNESNVDAASFAALLITMNALTMLQDRSIEPYEPPLEWLEVGRGAFSVLPSMEEIASGSRLGVLIETTAPIWQADKTLNDEMRREFAGVLDRTQPKSSDVWDDETVEAYEATLSYIGTFERAVNAGDAADICLRWICMFPFMVPRKYLDLVAERRPRALVTLAYFFALIQRTDSLQYLGNASDTPIGKREVCGISTALPREWHPLMSRALREVGAG